MQDELTGTDIPHVHGANEKGRDARAPALSIPFRQTAPTILCGM